MLNKKSIDRVDASSFSKTFRKPLYDSYCFSRIPDTISYLLTGKGKEKALPSDCYDDTEPFDAVILLFIDAFGWCMWQRFKEHPFLQRIEKLGILSKITSQFPSTTAAHMTTIHTGECPAQSGIYEWYQYEPKVGKVITPLMFSYAGDSTSETLLSLGLTGGDIFPFTTLYEKLHNEHIQSFLFQEAHINSSTYSQTFSKGAHLIGHFNLSQGLASLSELHATQASSKSYSFFYHSHIDFVGHRKGVESSSFEKSVLYCLDRLEKELIPALEKVNKKTALLVTADHGMVQVYPEKTLYINKLVPDLEQFLEVKDPAGSCRDMFLHVKQDKREEAIEKIQRAVEGKAEVWKIEEMIANGLFGKDPMSHRFLERVGNTVILPYEYEGVWWLEKHRFEQHFHGSHGGLTPQEMETIFGFLSF